MENASKALIIAGAILISIVLVSVGVIVVQSLNPDQAISQMSQQEIESFNSNFIGSIGNNKQGTLVRTLITTVATNNSQYADDESRQVKITIENVTGLTAKEVTDPNELSRIRNSINSSARYDLQNTVKGNGQVDVITITKK